MSATYIRRIFAFACVLTILCAAPACSRHEKTYRIGVSQCSDDDWRAKMNEEIMREALFHDNIEVEIRSADDSNDKQIADLRYFADNGFDIIVAAPNEAKALTPIIREIYNSGLPVVVFDRNTSDSSYTAFQGADNVEIGALAAKLARSMVQGPCNVIEIVGLEGSSPAIDRQKGFDMAAPMYDINILGHGYGDWNHEGGRRVADSLLALYPQTNLIYAHNDRMAIAASQAARQMGRDVKVIGVDAAPKIGIQAVADSIIDASFLYPTDGQQLIRTALAILQGMPYEKHLILPTPAPVDITNAEILLMQDNVLRDETDKIDTLANQMDAYWEEHSMQTTVLYGVVAILLLSAGFIFLLLRHYWQSQRHRLEIESRNEELSRQRDELDSLYQQLQDATSSKLTFFTNVSHDLRTPLTLIAEPVSQLAQAENITPKQRTLMQLADKNVRRLQRLINQILDIRKYDNGQLKLRLANVDMRAAVKEWAAPYGEIAAKKGIDFSVSVPDGQKLATAIDIEKIERVLFNLLSNAFKFTPQGGSIAVELKRQGDALLLSVADTGMGISADEINQIFQRFFKTDHINPNGSGIGLALSKVFVDMHGGNISVESTEGKGSVFTVALPIRQVEGAEAAAFGTADINSEAKELTEIETVEAEPQENAPTVLVIDDNPDIRLLVRSLLEDKFLVIEAANGTDGIAKAVKYVPNLIVCDVMMPGIDGYETSRRLKEDEATSHIPILLLTACSLDEQRTRGYECGVDGYMAKPFDAKMFLSRCDSLIQNRKRIFAAMAAPAPLQPQPQQSEQPEQQAPAKADDIDNEFYLRFCAIVEKDLSNSELSVEDVAAAMGLSRVQMYRKLKALTNFSPAELMRNLRLKHAADMLKSSQLTISEIAYAVGFSSPSYFTKCYREYYNEAPSETQAKR